MANAKKRLAAAVIATGAFISGCMPGNKDQASETSFASSIPSRTTSTTSTSTTTSTTTTTAPIPAVDVTSLEGVRFGVSRNVPIAAGMNFNDLVTSNPNAWTGVIDGEGIARLEYNAPNIGVSVSDGTKSTWLINTQTTANEGNFGSADNNSEHYASFASQDIAPSTNAWFSVDATNNRLIVRVNTPESSVIYFADRDGIIQAAETSEVSPSYIKSVEGSFNPALKTVVIDNAIPTATSGITALVIQTDNGSVATLNLKTLGL
jgi:hypothetical protein